MFLAELLTTYKTSAFAAINATTYTNKAELISSLESKFTTLESLVAAYKTAIVKQTDTDAILTLIKEQIVNIQTYTGMKNSLGNDELENGKLNGAVMATSITTSPVSSGSKTFEVSASGLDLIKGQLIKVTNSIILQATVTSYTGTSLVVSVTSKIGGTPNSQPWVITKDGTTVGTIYTTISVSSTPVSKTLAVLEGLDISTGDVLTLTCVCSMVGKMTSYSGTTLTFLPYDAATTGLGATLVGDATYPWNVYTLGYSLLDIMPAIVNPTTGLTDYRLMFTPWRTKLPTTGIVLQLSTYLTDNIFTLYGAAKVRYYKAYNDMIYVFTEQATTITNNIMQSYTTSNVSIKPLNGSNIISYNKEQWVYNSQEETYSIVPTSTYPDTMIVFVRDFLFPLSDIKLGADDPSLYLNTGRWALTSDGAYGAADGNGINLFTTKIVMDCFTNNKPPAALRYLQTDLDVTDKVLLSSGLGTAPTTTDPVSFKFAFDSYLKGSIATPACLVKEPFKETFIERSRYFSLGGATNVVYKKSPKDIMLTEFKFQEVIDYYGIEIPGL